MPVKRVLPAAAAELLAEGYRYVDVRSIPEFDAGHPAGAYNVPVSHFVAGRGMVPNPEFESVMEKRFAKDDKLILGCKSGGRSLRAAEYLTARGWTQLVDMQAGFDGERDMGGRVLVPGWRDAGLPVETAAPGRGWEELK
jgi:rhodanese-related sulfurtransferase